MAITYRRFETQDRKPVYRLFRDSVWDYMLQNGIATEDDSYDLDEYFQQQKDLYIHLEKNADEDWVAVDSREKLVGWARSIERDNHLELTHFFVDTSTQGSGVGHALLDLAFPVGRGQQRSIIATMNPRALSLYLRYDVSFQGMAFSVYGKPQDRRLESDLNIEQVTTSPQTLETIIDIENQILGYRRNIELEFFMEDQPVFLCYRNNRPVGYAFGCTANAAGPAAALDPEDLPALLHTIEQSALKLKLESLWLTIPANAKHAVGWALSRGYKIDPFHEALLAKNPVMNFDRYIMTQSAFVW